MDPENTSMRSGAAGRRHRQSSIEAADDPLYARGFLLTGSPHDSPRPDWLERRFGRLHLSYDARNDLGEAKVNGAGVLLLGTVIDPSDPAAGLNATARKAAAALSASHDSFLDLLGTLAGRFLLVYDDGRLTRITCDATCMRSAFYSRSTPLVMASHAKIVADTLGAPPDPLGSAIQETPQWRARRTVEHLPANLTPWEGVVFLTANMALDAEALELSRLWPRRPPPRRSTDEIAELCARAMQAQLPGLLERFTPVLVSATAGLDTRTTIAATYSARDRLQYFTHTREEKPASILDAAVATEIARAMDLDHQVLRLNERVSKEIETVLEANSFLSIHRAAGEAYRDRFPQTAVHVRSNVAEVGRAFFRKPPNPYPDRGNSALLARAYRRLEGVPEVVRAFAHWTEETGFWEVEGLDYLDLLYWEHRMPTWHGSLLLETDIAFESVSLFNQRDLLAATLSTSLASRQAGAVQRGVIERCCPALLRWPTDPEKRGWRWRLGALKHHLVERFWRLRQLLGPERRRINQ